MSDVGQALPLYAFFPILNQWASDTGADARLVNQIAEQAGMFCQFVGVPLLLIVLWFAIRRCNGPRFAEYLGLSRFPLRQLGMWGLISAGVMILGTLLAILSGDHSGAKFQERLVESRAPILLVMASQDFAAPFKEELLFRGFLYRGIAASCGWIAAILLPNLIWVLLHRQYDGAALTGLFFSGCIYGLARHFSGSVIPPMIFHILGNLVVTYVVYFVRA